MMAEANQDVTKISTFVAEDIWFDSQIPGQFTFQFLPTSLNADASNSFMVNLFDKLVIGWDLVGETIDIAAYSFSTCDAFSPNADAESTETPKSLTATTTAFNTIYVSWNSEQISVVVTNGEGEFVTLEQAIPANAFGPLGVGMSGGDWISYLSTVKYAGDIEKSLVAPVEDDSSEEES